MYLFKKSFSDQFIYRGVFGTQSNIYDGFFLRK